MQHTLSDEPVVLCGFGWLGGVRTIPDKKTIKVLRNNTSVSQFRLVHEIGDRRIVTLKIGIVELFLWEHIVSLIVEGNRP